MFGHLVVDCLKGEKLKDKVSSLGVVVVESSKMDEMVERVEIPINKEPINLKETCEEASQDLVETPRKNGEKPRTPMKVDTVG